MILKNLNKDFFYDGFDIEENFIEKSKIKYSDNSKFSFEKKSIHEIDFKKYDIEKTIVLLIGVFHHVSDEYIKIFLNKTKLFKVYAIDAVRLDGQNLFTKLLMDFDKGKYVRSENHYKKLLNEYQFILARNKYLNFKYDHLISIKRLDVNKVREILKD